MAVGELALRALECGERECQSLELAVHPRGARTPGLSNNMVDFHELTDRLERVYTPRLALRQVSTADAWPLFVATRNPLFNRYLLWEQPQDERVVWDRVQAIVDASRRGKLSAVSAVVRETGAWVSLFRFQPFGQSTDTMEMGVWTHHAYWQGRFSLELGRACVAAAFSFSEVNVLVGAAAPANKSSCRLMEQCGMSSGELVRRPSENGGTADLLEHRITRAQWALQCDRRAFEVVEPASMPTPASAPITVGNGRSGTTKTRSAPRAKAPGRIIVEPLTIEVRSGSRPRSRLRQSERPEGTGLIQVDSAGD